MKINKIALFLILFLISSSLANKKNKRKSNQQRSSANLENSKKKGKKLKMKSRNEFDPFGLKKLGVKINSGSNNPNPAPVEQAPLVQDNSPVKTTSLNNIVKKDIFSLPDTLKNIATNIRKKIPLKKKKDDKNDDIAEINPQGNFAFSCIDIMMDIDYKLYASCLDSRNNYIKNQIYLDSCIKDEEGILKPGQGFKKTARDCTLSKKWELTCRLVGQSKTGHKNSIELNSFIENRNGQLICNIPRKVVQSNPIFYKYGGNFAHSCRGITVVNDHTIQADCVNIQRKLINSRLDLSNCLENHNGQLAMGYDFQKSSKNCYVNNLGVFSCDTIMKNKNQTRSSIDLNLLVRNHDGFLQCISPHQKKRRSNHYYSTMKGGNFSYSCKNIKLINGILNANCDNGDNRFYPTNLNISDCVTLNKNGKIVPGKGFNASGCAVDTTGLLICRYLNNRNEAYNQIYDLNMSVANKLGKLVC